jgi:hypothetical protein
MTHDTRRGARRSAAGGQRAPAAGDGPGPCTCSRWLSCSPWRWACWRSASCSRWRSVLSWRRRRGYSVAQHPGLGPALGHGGRTPSPTSVARTPRCFCCRSQRPAGGPGPCREPRPKTPEITPARSSGAESCRGPLCRSIPSSVLAVARVLVARSDPRSHDLDDARACTAWVSVMRSSPPTRFPAVASRMLRPRSA